MCPSYSLFISLEENLQPSSWSWLTSPQYDHHKLFSTTGIASTLMTKRITFKVSNSSARQHGRNLIQKREKMKEPDNYNGSLEEVNIWYQRMTMFFQSDNIENDWERIKITLEKEINIKYGSYLEEGKDLQEKNSRRSWIKCEYLSVMSRILWLPPVGIISDL